MKLFISWSGFRSKHIAEALREWLPNVIQAVQPWMSAADMEKGGRWSLEMATQLEETHFGIICLTPENLAAPWILFEAGSLSRTVQNTHVCPFLFDIEPAELNGPLSQFQAARAQREETKQLVYTINRAFGAQSLPEGKVAKSFDLWWPELDAKLRSIPASDERRPPQRPEREILEEILATVRNQSSSQIRLPARALDSIVERSWETLEENVLALLRTEPNGLTAFQIAPLVGNNRPDVSRALHRLRDAQRVVQDFEDKDGTPIYKVF